MVLLEDSAYPGCAFRSSQKADERSKERNVDLCPSRIVGLAGQLSGPQSISASIYLSSESEHLGKQLSWTSLLKLTKHLNQNVMCRFGQLTPTPGRDLGAWRTAVSYPPREVSWDWPPCQSHAAGLHTTSGRLTISFLQGSHFHLAFQLFPHLQETETFFPLF